MKKSKLILIGGGGHCRSCIDVIEETNLFEIFGVVDKAKETSEIFGYPVIGTDKDLPILKKDFKYAFVAIGQIKSSVLRERLFKYLKSLGFKLPIIISPRAYVSKYAKISEGSIVMHDALVNSGATVGENCIINTKALIEHDVSVGDNCHISTNAVINGGAKISNGSFIGSSSIIIGGVQTKKNAFIKAGFLFKGHEQNE